MPFVFCVLIRRYTNNHRVSPQRAKRRMKRAVPRAASRDVRLYTKYFLAGVESQVWLGVSKRLNFVEICRHKRDQTPRPIRVQYANWTFRAQCCLECGIKCNWLRCFADTRMARLLTRLFRTSPLGRFSLMCAYDCSPWSARSPRSRFTNSLIHAGMPPAASCGRLLEMKSSGGMMALKIL